METQPLDAPQPDGMPATRGLNYFLADPNLQFVCATVMAPNMIERARPHLMEMGRLAGSELDALAAEADRNPPQGDRHRVPSLRIRFDRRFAVAIKSIDIGAELEIGV